MQDQSSHPEDAPDHVRPEDPQCRVKLVAALAPLGEPQSVRVLDYGCGGGRMTAYLDGLGYAAEGADVDASIIERNRRRFANIPFALLSADQPAEYLDGAFDAIYCSEVVEHVYNVGFIFSELSRLLRPGGRLILTTPYHGLAKNIIVALTCFDRHFDVTWQHIRFFSKNSLTRAATPHNLHPVQWSHVGRCWPVPRSFFVVFRRE